MTQQPKRIPGEQNPSADPSDAHRIQNAASASAGAGSGDLGVAAAIGAWRRWRARRRHRRAVQAHGTQRPE